MKELDDETENDLDIGELDIDADNILKLVDDGGEEVVEDGDVLVDVGDGSGLAKSAGLNLGDGLLCT